MVLHRHNGFSGEYKNGMYLLQLQPTGNWKQNASLILWTHFDFLYTPDSFLENQISLLYEPTLLSVTLFLQFPRKRSASIFFNSVPFFFITSLAEYYLWTVFFSMLPLCCQQYSHSGWSLGRHSSGHLLCNCEFWLMAAMKLYLPLSRWVGNGIVPENRDAKILCKEQFQSKR